MVKTVNKNVKSAYVLINTAVRETTEIPYISDKEITELYALFGEYNLLVKIESNNLKGNESILLNRLKSLDGIIDARTLLVDDRKEEEYNNSKNFKKLSV